MNYLRQKYLQLKMYMEVDRLNAMEVYGIASVIFGGFILGWNYQDNNIWTIIGSQFLTLGLLINALVYVVDEIRMGSPVWHQFVEEAKQQDEAEEKIKEIFEDMFSPKANKKEDTLGDDKEEHD